jgi:hypothetical protein
MKIIFSIRNQQIINLNNKICSSKDLNQAGKIMQYHLYKKEKEYLVLNQFHRNFLKISNY